ncbi:MAG: hypothetical protein ACREBW_08615 [Candidatus Micrarchaeaceae archaeon]
MEVGVVRLEVGVASPKGGVVSQEECTASLGVALQFTPYARQQPKTG